MSNDTIPQRRANRKGNGPLTEYFVTVTVERHTLVRARNEDEAKKQVLKKQVTLFGSNSGVKVISVVTA